jgi:hypothetical protein
MRAHWQEEISKRLTRLEAKTGKSSVKRKK